MEAVATPLDNGMIEIVYTQDHWRSVERWSRDELMSPVDERLVAIGQAPRAWDGTQDDLTRWLSERIKCRQAHDRGAPRSHASPVALVASRASDQAEPPKVVPRGL